MTANMCAIGIDVTRGIAAYAGKFIMLALLLIGPTSAVQTVPANIKFTSGGRVFQPAI